MPKSGIELISIECGRQLKEGSAHACEPGILAMKAACYCASQKIYVLHENPGGGLEFEDPWIGPSNTDERMDCGLLEDGGPPDPKSYTDEQRLDLLAKAGALIAAEIDLLQGRQNGSEAERVSGESP